MEINPTKTKCIVFSRRARGIETTCSLDGILIERCTNNKKLVVTYNSSSEFGLINDMTSTDSHMLGLIIRTVNSFTNSLSISFVNAALLYKALDRNLLEYNSTVLNHYDLGQINQLHSIQTCILITLGWQAGLNYLEEWKSSPSFMGFSHCTAEKELPTIVSVQADKLENVFPSLAHLSKL